MAGASRGKRGGRGGGNNVGRPHISIGPDKLEVDDPLDFKAPELFPPLRATVTEIEEDSEDDDLISFEKKLAKHFNNAASFISKEEFTTPWSYLKSIENHNYFPPSLLPKKKKNSQDEKPLTDKQWMENLKSEITNHDYLSLQEIVSAKKNKIDDFLCPANKKKAKTENPKTSLLINESHVKELDEEEDIDVEDNEEPKKKEDEDKDEQPKDIEEEFESDVDDELDDGTDYNKNYFDNGEGYLDDEDDGLDDNDAIY